MKLYFAYPSLYSQKALLALYEKRIDFEPVEVNLFDPNARAAYREIHPIGKVPLLDDDGYMVPESSIIVEYLDQHFQDTPRLLPADPEVCRRTRFFDRALDFYVANPCGTIFFDARKPETERNAEAVEQAHHYIDVTTGHLEKALSDDREWLNGDQFSLADCSAAGALFYASLMHGLDGHPNLEAYFARTQQRDSVQRLMSKVRPALESLAA